MKPLSKILYEKYWAYFHFVRHYEWSIVSRWLNPKKGQRICDLACGGGIFSNKIAKRGAFVDGVDIDKKVIAIANNYNSHKNCSFHVGAAESLPFKKNVFDSVFSVCSFQHFQNEAKSFAEISRVLKKDGTLVFSADSYTLKSITARQKKIHAEKEGVRCYYNVDSVDKALGKAGLSLSKKKYILNSGFSHWIMQLWDKFNHNIVFLLLFPLIYPLVRFSDLLMGRKNQGYILVILAKKI